MSIEPRVVFSIVVGLATGFCIAVRLLATSEPSPLREDIPLTQSDFTSIIGGQPMPEGSREIIVTSPGHPAGHVLMSKPKTLVAGNYAVEMQLEAKLPQDATKDTCIMDLLAGNVLIGAASVNRFDSEVKINFRSPAANGSSEFSVRLFCDGRETVQVFSVTYQRNPNSRPSVIYTR